ncbi:hypothetical protein Kisp01_51700 [Kineosporia sp. NBRC 101677]|uniref:hypothetical protein n=1 Tax=Kineosporia sp. NBRC 101677 TaxID=3032197 RepID=UPI0024A13C8A|nr:hypothetical protein [Kineosporia sp. NBRC 101677]GLY18156.1 hypothetical protein Kisp01_51700 [Kineosporia sp. NBRC 101677]
MAEPADDITASVEMFLPLDMQRAFSRDPDLAVMAAALGSFSAAVFHTVVPMSPSDRLDFCRRVAASSNGDFPAWMVEASLRSIEGDRTAMDGTDPAVTLGIPIHGLVVLNSDYLTTDAAHALRGRAEELAQELLPRWQALPPQ